MPDTFKEGEYRPIPLRSYALGAVALWSLLIVLSLGWNLKTERSGTLEAARIEARTAFETDILYRRWNAKHGGLYGPVTEETLPNPYLEVPERDITTPSGKQLTLINPAYMTRQVHEIEKSAKGVMGHITSLDPIRPANAPDPWEALALKAFQTGAKEVSSVKKMEGKNYMRLMKPLVTEQECLRCHAVQGYKLGDIRGGISVSVPMAPLMTIERHHYLTLSAGHGVLWLVGLFGIGFAMRRFSQQIKGRLEAEKELQNAHDELEIRVEKRTNEFLVLNEKLNREIEKHLQTQKTLRKSEAKFRGIFEYTKNGVATYQAVNDGRNFVFVDFNKSAEKIDKIKREDLIGKSVEQVFPGVVDFGLLDVFKRVWKSGQPEHYPITMYKDQRVSGWRENFVYKLPSGEIVAVYSDETERKQAEKNLGKNRKMLKLVFDGISDPLIMVGKEMNLEMLNKAACEYKQIINQNAIREPCFLGFKGKSELCEECAILQAVMEGRSISFERKNCLNPDRLEKVVIYSLQEKGQKEEFALIHISDITKEIFVQQQLIQREKMASVGELAAGVAHEINNPINGVINYAQLLIDEDQEQGDEAGIPRRIMKEAERVAKIVKNLLSFSRETEDAPTPVTIQDIVSDTIELVEMRFNNDGIQLGIDIPDDLPGVIVNRHKIQQVFLNLLSNAHYALNEKFSEFDANKVITIKGEATEVNGEKYSRIKIQDQGIGIPEEIIEKICDPFFSTKPSGEGTGLGLSISFGIIKDQGGNLLFESIEGEYTRVIVDLPAIVSE